MWLKIWPWSAVPARGTAGIGSCAYGRNRVAVVLSVVIPSHCGVDLLRACLDSITRHAPPGIEILVIDDASPGHIVETTATQFPRVSCLRLCERRGFAVAANAGIRAARHPFGQLINDDTEVTPGSH